MAELSQDGWHSIQRPRWYHLRLSLASRMRDPVLMYSTRIDEPDRVAQVINEAIRQAGAKAAS